LAAGAPPPTRQRIGRRLFLTELGRRTFAVTILGAAVLSSCSDDSGSGSGSGSGSAPATGGDTPPSDTAPSADATTTSTEAAAPLTWERVNLGFVSAYVLVRGNEAAVVDTGVPGSEAQISDVLGGLGLGWGDVDHVVLTHFHPDHAGSVSAVLEAAGTATGYAGEADLEAIQSPRPLVALGDGDDVFGLEVIATPGHTAGHISVYDHESGLLVAGDSLNPSADGIGGAAPQFSADMTQADASAQKLAELDVDTVLFGHGDPVEGGAGPMLDELAASLPS
jgi:glyoxylase-like metal-dependent hydrolase (beta-lactamase superfamily II)